MAYHRPLLFLLFQWRPWRAFSEWLPHHKTPFKSCLLPSHKPRSLSSLTQDLHCSENLGVQWVQKGSKEEPLFPFSSIALRLLLEVAGDAPSGKEARGNGTATAALICCFQSLVFLDWGRGANKVGINQRKSSEIKAKLEEEPHKKTS